MSKAKTIDRYLIPGCRVHLVGIGGVSMRPLGLVLKGMGMEVTGSNMNSSVSTDELIQQGIPVAIGHQAVVDTLGSVVLLSGITGVHIQTLPDKTYHIRVKERLFSRQFGL